MTAVSPEPTVKRLPVSRESTALPIPIVQATLKQHDYLTRPSDRLRKVPHEDCCGYCELYCQDKITPQRHKEIVAWREEVNENLDPVKMSHNSHHRQPKLKFLKNIPLSHYSDIPDDLDNSFRSRGKSQNSKRLTTPRTDSDLVSDFASMALVPLEPCTPRSGSTDNHGNTGRARNGKSGKVIAGCVQAKQTERDFGEEGNNTDVSHRTMSNQLLNVLTIDDAMRQHRYRIEANRQTRIKSAHGRISPEIEVNGDNNSDVGDLKYLEYSGNHDNSDLGQEKYQRIIPVDTNGLPVRSIRQVLYPESTMYSPNGNEQLDGPNEQLMRAVEHVLEQKAVTNIPANTGLLRVRQNGRQSPAAKPESKRFQRLNKKLHQLMEVEYLPNYKLNAKINHSRSISACSGEKTPVERHSGKSRARTTMSLPGSGQNSRAKTFEFCKKQSRSPIEVYHHGGKETFLEMIMDMDEKVVPVELI